MAETHVFLAPLLLAVLLTPLLRTLLTLELRLRSVIIVGVLVRVDERLLLLPLPLPLPLQNRRDVAIAHTGEEKRSRCWSG